MQSSLLVRCFTIKHQKPYQLLHIIDLPLWKLFTYNFLVLADLQPTFQVTLYFKTIAQSLSLFYVPKDDFRMFPKDDFRMFTPNILVSLTQNRPSVFELLIKFCSFETSELNSIYKLSYISSLGLFNRYICVKA